MVREGMWGAEAARKLLTGQGLGLSGPCLGQ